MEELHEAPLLEVCVESAEGAVAAAEGGARRVELCSALGVGGLTPSPGAIRAARERLSIGLVVLLRPRPGDFLYSRTELEVLEQDLAFCRDAGVDGVALGLLRADGRIDLWRTQRLVELARPMSVTFHRAFDLCDDLEHALEELVQLGVERVLSSGGEASALEGADRLRALVLRASGRIGIVAGGGVREHNVRELLERTGVRELHFTATVARRSPMVLRRRPCSLGSGRVPSELEVDATDPEVVRRLASAARRPRAEPS